MKSLLEKALAALRWGWEKLLPLAKAAWTKLRDLFDTVYDPPPKTIRFWFWSFAIIVLVCWLTFAFVNSWFYKPTVQALAEFSYILSGDDGDVDLPAIEPLQPAAAPAVELPAVEVVCQDMSDTPKCETVVPQSRDKADVAPLKQQEVATPKDDKPKAKRYIRRAKNKHKPYQTYWGF